MGTLPHKDSPLFVFGSLLDDDILRVVLGARSAVRLRREEARVRGFHRRRVHDEPYPMLVPHPATPAEAEVRGVLLHGLDTEAWARLRFYEGPGYALHPLDVELPAAELVAGDEDHERRRRCSARVFLATERLRDSGQPWDLTHWQRTEKPLALLLARDLMALYGRTGPDGPPDAVWEDIKARRRAQLERAAHRAARHSAGPP